MVKVAIVIIGIAAIMPQARAQEHRCRVMDPTGTPLNVRSSPTGLIVGTLSNGRAVYVIDHGRDAHGKDWVYVGDSAANTPIGWVFRDFIDCIR